MAERAGDEVIGSGGSRWRRGWRVGWVAIGGRWLQAGPAIPMHDAAKALDGRPERSSAHPPPSRYPATTAASPCGSAAQPNPRRQGDIQPPIHPRVSLGPRTFAPINQSLRVRPSVTRAAIRRRELVFPQLRDGRMACAMLVTTGRGARLELGASVRLLEAMRPRSWPSLFVRIHVCIYREHY